MNVLDTADAEGFMRDHGLDYDLLLGGEDLLEALLGGASVPSYAVIDSEGRILGTGSGYFGSGSDEYLRELVGKGLDHARRNAGPP